MRKFKCIISCKIQICLRWLAWFLQRYIIINHTQFCWAYECKDQSEAFRWVIAKLPVFSSLTRWLYYGGREVQNNDSENKITHYKHKCKPKKNLNNNSENIISSQKTQWQFQKQYNKSENNDKSDKPKEVGIVWDSAIGLGIDYSPLTARDICQSRCTGRTRRRTIDTLKRLEVALRRMISVTSI